MIEKAKEIMTRGGKLIQVLRKKLPVKILMWLSVPLYTMFCLFVMEYFNYYHYNHMASTLRYFRESPGLSFAVLIVFVIMAVLLLLVRKVWIAAGIMGLLSLICSYVNFMKLALNGDNFYPRDIIMTKSAGELLSFVTTPMPGWFWLAVAATVLAVVLYALMGTQLPVSWKIRLPAAAVVLALVIYPCVPARAQQTVMKFGISFGDTILQSSNYYANGFVSAFALNVLKLGVQEPEDYSRDAIEEIMSDYSDTPATGEESFDVIVVLSEAFFDLRMLPGLTFSENPLERYDEILARDNCYSGLMYSNAHGGGTVRPEFEMITGLSTDYNDLSSSSPWDFVTDFTETYVTNYKDAGYDTIALHPYNEKFYGRSYAYGYAGFDEFYGQSALSDLVYLEYKREYVTDESTLRAMEYFLDRADDPMFMFAITMQNHQAYEPLPEEDIHLRVYSDDLSESVLDSVTTYAQGLYDADKMLGGLCDYIDARERPTILVFFGDHLPTLGANRAAYNQTGLVDSSDGEHGDELLTLYSTPFLIYSNRDIEISMFGEHTGNGISPYNVLNAVALATGFQRTAYMNLLLDLYEVAPFYNVKLELSTTEELQQYLDAIRLITYDRTSGDRYSVD